MAAILRVFLGIFAVAAAAFLCWTGILLRRKRILKNRQQRFMQQDRNRGICEISYGLYQMLRDADVCREYTMEDGEYARMMEDELKILEKGEYEAFLRLVQAGGLWKSGAGRRAAERLSWILQEDCRLSVETYG